MRPAISLSIVSCTLLASASAAQLSRRDDHTGTCMATLKNANGHNAQHKRFGGKAKDFGWHAAFAPGAQGHSHATLFTGNNCVVTVYIDLAQCAIDGARFGTPLTGKALHYSARKPKDGTALPSGNATLPNNNNDTLATNTSSFGNNLSPGANGDISKSPNETLSSNPTSLGGFFSPVSSGNVSGSPNATPPGSSTSSLGINTTPVGNSFIPGANVSMDKTNNETFGSSTTTSGNSSADGTMSSLSGNPTLSTGLLGGFQPTVDVTANQSSGTSSNFTGATTNGKEDENENGGPENQGGDYYADDNDSLVGPVNWKKGCSEGMFIHVDF